MSCSEEEVCVWQVIAETNTRQMLNLREDMLDLRQLAQGQLGAIQRVHELHKPDINEAEHHCRSCHKEYPCDTIRALGG